MNKSISNGNGFFLDGIMDNKFVSFVNLVTYLEVFP